MAPIFTVTIQSHHHLLALQDGEKDSWLELKSQQSAHSLLQDERNNHNGIGVIQILHIQEELDYVINHLDFILDPEQVSEQFKFIPFR